MSKSSESLRIELFNKLWAYWTENPDLRFCQMLGNCFEQQDLYYIEDAELLEKLKK